ncbi:5-formyltetrahydrofolate cyclo-ligase [Microlunatus endophyticus]|uniref:5-formyltetrahydrofolate cyclo-ligase n=1 Tax=Microlunatus endophyticus TaxID=1716077 RepID=A0A917W981_9ACTN|nr:5-formyltetrahydrofolate cyclo-ligase [Microlunatus endophyticus]
MGRVFRPLQSPADVAAIAEAKRVLRRALVERRRVHPDEQRAADDAARFERIREFFGSSALGTAASYFSVPPEPGTLQAIAWLASRDVRVLLPVLTEPEEPSGIFGAPDWAPYAGPDRLQQGRLGLIEPTTSPVGAAALAEAELIIVPGVAGSAEGDRLGRGGGWYDRALRHAARSAVTVLLLNDDEVLDVIPAHRHDRRVDVIITPTRILDCG